VTTQSVAGVRGGGPGGTSPRPQEKHVQPPPVESDQTVRQIADLLIAATTVGAAVTGLVSLLAVYGIHRAAIEAVFSMLGGGTNHTPNARLVKYGVPNTGQITAVKRREVFYRAAYVANAAKRVQHELDRGSTPKQAVDVERRFFVAHEEARKGRLDAAAQAEYAAAAFGWVQDDGKRLVGWYLNPLLNNEVECKAANGNNFLVEDGTIIGLPGAVHARCGCYTGPPHSGAAMVNDAVRKVVILKQRQRPKFKLRGA
jgi:hypothetical protein